MVKVHYQNSQMVNENKKRKEHAHMSKKGVISQKTAGSWLRVKAELESSACFQNVQPQTERTLLKAQLSFLYYLGNNKATLNIKRDGECQ